MKLKLSEVYEIIIQEYGQRKCWLSELATMLHITYTEANRLTLALNFRRGKATVVNSYDVFSKNEKVRSIQDRYDWK